jgi:hypothetical protein
VLDFMCCIHSSPSADSLFRVVGRHRPHEGHQEVKNNNNDRSEVGGRGTIVWNDCNALLFVLDVVCATTFCFSTSVRSRVAESILYFHSPLLFSF